MKDKFYLLIAGGRDYDNANNIILFINSAMNAAKKNDQQLIIVHGAAKGADSLAGQLAQEAGLMVVPFPAEWYPDNKYDNAAGYKRNVNMADFLVEKKDEGHRAEVLTFAGGKGTAHMRDIANKKGLKLVVAAEPRTEN